MIFELAIIAVVCCVIAGMLLDISFALKRIADLLEISFALKRIADHLESNKPEAPIDL